MVPALPDCVVVDFDSLAHPVHESGSVYTKARLETLISKSIAGGTVVHKHELSDELLEALTAAYEEAANGTLSPSPEAAITADPAPDWSFSSGESDP
jgi:hypothetical protein